jgi:hypothetical protein
MRASLFAAALLLGAAGCKQILGIEDLSGDGDGGGGADGGGGSADAAGGGDSPGVTDAAGGDAPGAVDGGGDASGCTAPFTPVGADGCYALTIASTWTAADLECTSMGGRLMVIADAAKNDQVRTFLAAFPAADTPSAWLGLRDLGSDGTWFWSDGSALGYQAWASGEPSAPGGTPCAWMRNMPGMPQHGTWEADPCNTALGGLCERP